MFNRDGDESKKNNMYSARLNPKHFKMENQQPSLE